MGVACWHRDTVTCRTPTLILPLKGGGDRSGVLVGNQSEHQSLPATQGEGLLLRVESRGTCDDPHLTLRKRHDDAAAAECFVDGLIYFARRSPIVRDLHPRLDGDVD
jgi:hypothetical protein